MVKISRPRPRDIYLRHRLFEFLDELRRFPVVWVSAPAGSGKTTLISSYIGVRSIPCLWYQIDHRDADVATFFYYLGEATKKIMLRKRISLPFLTPEYLQGVSTFVLRYFEKLYRHLPPPFLLVFDNYHEAPLDSPIHEVMSGAFSLIPEGVNVVAISRNDPPPPLSRLKANGSMGLIRWEDVRLTEDEAQGIIGRKIAGSAPKETMRRLYELSDGWAAGLVLLSEAAKGDNFSPEFAEKQSFDEVFDYFATEVFRHLDEKSREFFLTTAFLPKMTAPMAAQLTGNKAAGSILLAMNRNNYFIMRHTGAEAVYEYHPLYRNFLLNRSETTFSTEILSNIRRTAAAILEEAGMTEAAILLLKDVADWEAMIGIILSHAPDMVKKGRYRPLQAWLENLPAAIRESTPWLLFWEGMSIFPFSPAEAGPTLEKAFAGFEAAGDTIGAMLAASGVINSIGYKFNELAALDHWYTVLNGLAVKTPVFPNAEIEARVITSLVFASKIRETSAVDMETWAERALHIAESPQTINSKTQALHILFWHCMIHKGAPEAYPLLLELRRLSRLPETQPLISIEAQTAEVAYHLVSGSHDEVITAAQQGLELSRTTGIHIEDMWFYTRAVTSFINKMDIQGAAAWFDHIPPMAAGWPNWSKAIYYRQLMRIALIRGEYQQALVEGKLSLDFATRAGSPLAMASSQLLLAQLFQIMGKHEEALKYLEMGRTYAVQRNSTICMTSVLMIEAQVAFDEGNDARGLLVLGKSLALARECGYVLSMFDNPVMTLQLCEKALTAGIEVEHVQKIIRKRGFVPEKPPVHIENWPWDVKVYTMGRFGIIRNGNPIQFSGRVKQTPLRLLKVLIALGGREIEESTIAALLWPDADGDMAHQSFETNLHRLRKLLGLSEALRLSDGKATLDNRYCWVDAWAFERLIGQADEARHRGETDHVPDLTEKAIGLYHGAFLAGEPAEVWVVSSSERLRSKLLRSVSWLGSHLEGQGAWGKAVAHYERCLEIDDLVEDLYCRLMVCYRHIGKRSDALATYERCKKTLSRTLGISPSPATEALHIALLSGKKS
jgi:LuxR family transcriptional regulator, maltose regulon positive regulatory protein